MKLYSNVYDHAIYTWIIIKKNLLFFFTVYKNEQKEHKFWRQKILKGTFYRNKKVNSINDIDFNKVLLSKKEPYCTKNSFKYFTGYNDNDVIRPLCLRLPQMTGYARKFDENETMSFKANNKQLLKDYNKNMGKSGKVNEDRFWEQTFLSW